MTRLEWLFQNKKDYIKQCVANCMAVFDDGKIKDCMMSNCERCVFKKTDKNNCGFTTLEPKQWLDEEVKEGEEWTIEE